MFSRVNSAPSRTAVRVGIAALALALVACGPEISSDRDQTIPIPKGATYWWAGGAAVTHTTGGSAMIQNDIIHQRIQTAINAQMAAKGYKLTTDSAAANFFVRYYIGTKTEVSYQSTTTGMAAGPGWGYGWGYGGVGVGMSTTTTHPIETTVGGVVIDLVENHTGKLAWRGIVKGDVPDQAPSQERVNEVAGQVMETLPSAM
ncbi:MAG TPA: DUF4136 domain-containing protein [Gemmatimonadaceae bacterium]|nr:DUF4136 domain-containing protein [Gemmatimonadaceae bacterium]